MDVHVLKFHPRHYGIEHLTQTRLHHVNLIENDHGDTIGLTDTVRNEIEFEHASGLVGLAEVAAVVHFLIEFVRTMEQEQEFRLITEFVHDQTSGCFSSKG
jgi:hypothetical protein